MRSIAKLALASASLLALATPVYAQDSAAQGADEATDDGDIVVTARRRDESAQDVPLVVNAVTSETLQKLNIREFTDIQRVVPGLSLAVSPNGIGTTASLRGVAYDVNASGNNGTIEFYLNDAPTSSGIVFQSMFDVDQIEVLRGPQGTLRGRASPSGSITITTRKPDLNEFGGYINMTGTTLNSINVNAAVGVPIIADKLALRVAGIYEETDGNRVHRSGGGVNPYVKTKGVRATLRFDPIDNLSINASYTKTVRDALQYDQVESANLAVPGLPASPVLIRAGDRLAVESLPRTFRQDFDVFNWQADFRFAGQRLVYVGSYNKQRYTTADPNDKGNFFAGALLPVFNGLPAALGGAVALPTLQTVPSFGLLSQDTRTQSTQETHELRLQSDERVFGIVDYVIGGLINKSNSPTVLSTTTPLINVPVPLPNPPGGFLFFPTLVNVTPVLRPAATLERSVFANLTVHLTDRTEVSGGLRYINYKESASLNISGVDVPAARKTGNPPEENVIWSASLKHRFNDSFMAYFNFGTSWRPGSTTNAIVNRNNTVTSPRLAAFLFPGSEKSQSYEVGFKSDWFDRRLRLNVTAYLQNFSNYAYSSPNVFAVATDASNVQTVQVFSPAFNVGVPVQVKGIEAELEWNSGNFSAGATLSYSLAKIKNGVIPCNDFYLANGTVGRDNIPDTQTPTVGDILLANGGETFSTCTVNYRAGTLPPFSATLRAEYNHPLSSRVDGYVRGLASIYGASQNDPGNPLDDVSAYALVNLYAGIRDPERAWEVSLFVKNLFDTERVLSRNSSPYTAPYQNLLASPSGQLGVTTYRGITMTPPREFGLNVRYSFGSR